MKKIYLIIFIIFFLVLFNSIVYANNELIYIDKRGYDTKYHSIICDYITPNNYISITVEEAFEKGYRRCSNCNPAMSDMEKNIRLERARQITQSINPSTSNTQYSNNTKSSQNNKNNKSSSLLERMLVAGIAAFILGLIEIFVNKKREK